MTFPSVLGIMDNFIITNVHDATPKTSKNDPNFFPIFISWGMKNNNTCY